VSHSNPAPQPKRIPGRERTGPGDQVLAAAQQQIDAMRAAGYARSQILGSGATILNSTTALYHQTFSRHSSDGSEISRGTTTYLVTDGPAGRRISVLAMHSP